MAKDVGIGMIGTGFARKVQMPAFNSCDGARITSVASGSIDNARAAAAEFGVGHFTDDWRETASHPDVDLVCITTPPNLHREMTLFSVEHGKHILCEKPIAMNAAQAREMTTSAAKAAVIAMIDHELRFLPGRQKAFAMLREGVIGKVRHAKYNFRASYRADPDRPWNWWSDAEQGGGALGAINSHIIDSLRWFLGAEINRVFCQLQTHILERRDENGRARKVTSDDEANMLLRFEDSGLTEGATTLISCSMSEPPGNMNRVEFFGSDGAMRVDNLGELFVAKRDGAEWARIDVEEPITGNPNDNGFSRGFRYIAPKIVEAILEGKDSVHGAATFADGVRVQRVLDAARESNAEGRVVDLQSASLGQAF
jgi:predicted dehydrogenase